MRNDRMPCILTQTFTIANPRTNVLYRVFFLLRVYSESRAMATPTIKGKSMLVKPRIKAGDAVRDIRLGMTDSQLMEKYGISAKGLHSLFAKLIEAEVITAAEIDQRREDYHDTTIIERMGEEDIIEDIRSGMTDSKLMEKYGLSADGFQMVLQMLIETNAITLQELYDTVPSAHDTVSLKNMRELPRQYLAVAVDIYESKRPEIRGTLSNVTEKGMAITGIAAQVGEFRTFVIPAEDFIEADPILLEAQCRWGTKEKSTGESLAGFEITKISEKGLDDLRRLMGSLSFFG
jgi:uncharacterized protein (DUF433 family)